MSTRELLADGLSRARERTRALVAFEDDELRRQYHPLMSPLVWDLAHIGQQEELWLLRDGNLEVPGLLPRTIEGLYDAFVHSRASRADLPLLSPAEAHRYLETVRGKALDVLDAADEDHAFRFALVISHENQHNETMLQALGMRTGAPLLSSGTPLPTGRPGVTGTSVEVPAGDFVLGVDPTDEPFSLDNERPAHAVFVPGFRIGRVPVTNREWRAFLDDGGYRRPELWSTRGWEHRTKAELTAPMYWNADGTRTRFGHLETIPDDEPVQHVSYFEAQAYARWAGARLPTEVEWEKAAAWDPALGRRRRFPWGAAPRPGGCLPRRRVGLRRRADVGRRVGMDQLPAAALAGVHADDLRPLYRALLRGGLPRAARRILGGGRRHPAPQLPQLGPPDPAADLLRCAIGLGSVDVPPPRLAG